MYEAFFGLRNRPFSPLPRVDTFVSVAPLRESLTSLTHCIEQEQGIGVLTSPVGSGKSLICRLLYHHFRDIRRTVLLTTARFPTRRALLQAILFELKHPYVGLSEQEARLRILDLLQASPAPLNRMLLIVDEAHLLSPRGLEELRTLTDYEMEGTPCISLILSGQLELEELLTEPDMNALNQRVGCHVCIEPFTFEESGQYIRERLRLAGNDGLTIFTHEAVQLICSASEGNPRRLNQLCDHSLLLAFAEETRPVNESLVRAALLDLRELPLHWNAPLDLTSHADRNPLEQFVDTLDADGVTFHDAALSEFDTEIELEDGSEFDATGFENSTLPESSVYEVGPAHQELPIDQLFQVDKFVVPNDFSSSWETSELTLDPTGMTASTESHAFEPPAAWEEILNENSKFSPSHVPQISEGLPGHALKSGGEMIVEPTVASGSFTPESYETSHSVEHAGADRPMGFEEIAVDDVYAVIDRLGESHAQFQIVGHNQVRPTHLAPKHAAALASAAQESYGGEIAEVTPCGESHDLSTGISASAFEQSVTPSQSALLESQLLDFINEISVDVRQFRNELDARRTGDTLAGTMDHPAQEVDRLRHQSLRRALSWQFDVVEPEEAAAVQRDAESPANSSIPESPSSTNVNIDSSLAAMTSDTIKAADPTQSADPNVAGRYSQLFTRLQRQRRRVELVMNHERRSGADARQS